MLSNLKHALIASLLCLGTANATTIAVLEITAANDEMNLTVEETKFITDELRRQAVRLLPKDYSVLTREKIISLVPKTVENLTSVIDIGMVIKSDYVTRGFIGKLGSLFTLTVELYETASGNLLGDFVKESTDLKGLLDAIRENSPNIFAKIKPLPIEMPETASIAGTANDTQSVAAAIPANIPAEPRKIKTAFWVAIGLDVLGATAVGLGVYNNAKAGSYHREKENLLGEPPSAQGKEAFNAKDEKMRSAETARNIFYATGSALLLGGIAVHIFF